MPRRRLLLSDHSNKYAVPNRYLHVPLVPGEGEELREGRTHQATLRERRESGMFRAVRTH